MISGTITTWRRTDSNVSLPNPECTMKASEELSASFETEEPLSKHRMSVEVTTFTSGLTRYFVSKSKC